MANRVGNWPLLIKTIKHIIKHPETWRQSSWISDCGTFACVAGWAAQLGGMKPFLVPQYMDTTPSQWPFTQIFTGKFAPNSHFVPADQRNKPKKSEVPKTFDRDADRWRYIDTLAEGAVYAHEAAAELLGISDDQGSVLFAANNEMRDILRYVREWAEEDGVRLPKTIREAMKNEGPVL